MKITLHGAAGGEVTGSGTLLETDRAQVLVDFGMFQGGKEGPKFNRLPASLRMPKLNAVVLTHAHLDHVGRLPLLVQAGYRGPIYGTAATLDLADLVLRDAAGIMQKDSANPLFDAKDVTRVAALGQPIRYGERREIAPGVVLRLSDAGHLLGSASVELTVTEAERTQVVVISGDLGQRGAPLHTDPVPFKTADIVFMESTYGGRDHKRLAETAIEAREVVRRVIERGGKVLVPIFALGRTQQLLYLIAGAFHRRTLPRFPIYIDSPMAVEATTIYRRQHEFFDEEARAMARSGELRRGLSTVQVTAGVRDSRRLAERPGPLMILAGSGMCNAGRIRYHLKYALPNERNAVLLTGYQSPGTLGRDLVDRRRTVTIDGERIPVRASVHTFGGLSAHAGQQDLVDWLGSMAASKPRVILTHGEGEARMALSARIRERFRLNAEIPALGETIIH